MFLLFKENGNKVLMPILWVSLENCGRRNIIQEDVCIRDDTFVRLCVYVRVCVWERERERQCVCCVCVRERECVCLMFTHLQNDRDVWNVFVSPAPLTQNCFVLFLKLVFWHTHHVLEMTRVASLICLLVDLLALKASRYFGVFRISKYCNSKLNFLNVR